MLIQNKLDIKVLQLFFIYNSFSRRDFEKIYSNLAQLIISKKIYKPYILAGDCQFFYLQNKILLLLVLYINEISKILNSYRIDDEKILRLKALFIRIFIFKFNLYCNKGIIKNMNGSELKCHGISDSFVIKNLKYIYKFKEVFSYSKNQITLNYLMLIQLLFINKLISNNQIFFDIDAQILFNGFLINNKDIFIVQKQLIFYNQHSNKFKNVFYNKLKFILDEFKSIYNYKIAQELWFDEKYQQTLNELQYYRYFIFNNKYKIYDLLKNNNKYNTGNVVFNPIKNKIYIYDVDIEYCGYDLNKEKLVLEVINDKSF